MKKYNYYVSVYDCIADYVKDQLCRGLLSHWRDGVEQELLDLADDDAVTGAHSGSYTCHRGEAEENLCHNLGLLKEACEALGCEPDIFDDPEGCDVLIRQYMVGQVVGSVIENEIPEEWWDTYDWSRNWQVTAYMENEADFNGRNLRFLEHSWDVYDYYRARKNVEGIHATDDDDNDLGYLFFEEVEDEED